MSNSRDQYIPIWGLVRYSKIEKEINESNRQIGQNADLVQTETIVNATMTSFNGSLVIFEGLKQLCDTIATDLGLSETAMIKRLKQHAEKALTEIIKLCATEKEQMICLREGLSGDGLERMNRILVQLD